MSSNEEFVKVLEKESCEVVVELPVESDGTLLLTTLQGQFPNAAGLRYRNSSGGWRGVRITGDVLNPPAEGWGYDTIYQITIKKDDETNTKEKDDIAEATRLQINQQLLCFSQLIQDKNSSDDIVGLTVEGTQEKMINQFKDFAKSLAKGAGVKVAPAGEISSSIDAEGALCKYFRIGVCKNGSTCRFCHPGINDIGTKRKTQDSPKEKEDIPPKASKHANEESKNVTHNLVVLDLPWITIKDLKKYFTTTCGEMENCSINIDRDKNRVKPRGLGFIRFKTTEGEVAALTQQHRINGTLVKVQLKATTKLYVTGILKETSNEDLKNYFETFAEVTKMDIPRPVNGVGYGFVTVKFPSQHARTTALERTHTLTLRTPYKICDVKLNVTEADSSMLQMKPKRRKKRNNRRFNIHDGEYGNDYYEMDSRDIWDRRDGSGKYGRNMYGIDEYTSDMVDYIRYGCYNSADGNYGTAPLKKEETSDMLDYGTDIAHGIASPLIKEEDTSDLLDYYIDYGDKKI